MRQIDDWAQFKWLHAFRCAVAVSVCLFIINQFTWPLLAFMAPTSAFVIMNVFKNQTVSSAIQRIVGPFIFSIFALLCAYFVHNPWLNTVFLFLLLLIGSYLFARAYFPYAAIMGCLIGTVIFSVAATSTHPDFATLTAISFVAYCVIGVVIAWLATRLIFPNRAKRELLPQLGLTLDAIKESYKSKKAMLSLESFTPLKHLFLNCEHQFKPAQARIIEHLIIELKQLYLKVERINQEKRTQTLGKKLPELGKALRALDQAMIDRFSAFAQALKSSKPLSHRASEISDMLNQLDSLLSQLREQGELLKQDVLSVLKLTSCIQSYRLLNQKLEACIKAFNASFDTHTTPKQLNAFLPGEKSRLWQWDKKTARRTFKISIVLLIVYYFVTQQHLPGSFQAIITAGIIAAQPNLGQSTQKLWQRFLGIVVGGLIGFGLLLLLGHTSSLWLLIPALFILTLVFSYIAQGSDTVSYFGIQAGVILFILVAMLEPSHNTTMAIQRLEGVFSGGLIALIVAWILFPVHPRKLLRKQLGVGLQLASQLTTAINQHKVSDVRIILRDALSGKKQLLDDLNGLGSQAADRQILDSFNLLEECFEQLAHLNDIQAQVNKSQLCQRADRDLQTVRRILPRIFEQLGTLDTANVKQLDPERLIKTIGEIAQSYRERRITYQYPLEESELYANYVCTWIFIAERAVLLKALLLKSS